MAALAQLPPQTNEQPAPISSLEQAEIDALANKYGVAPAGADLPEAGPMTGDDWMAALGKTFAIAAFVFSLIFGVCVVGVGGIATAELASTILQVGLTTLCVGGWFTLFLAFDKHFGTNPEH